MNGGARVYFLQDGCERLARNVSDLLTLVSRHVAIEDVISVVKSLPICPEDLSSEEWRKGTLNRALEVAHMRELTEPEKQRRDQLCDYFLGYLPNQSPNAVAMLQASFAGVL